MVDKPNVSKATAQPLAPNQALLNAEAVASRLTSKRNTELNDRIKEALELIPVGSEVIFFHQYSQHSKYSRVKSGIGILLGYIFQGSDLRAVIRTDNKDLTFSLKPQSYPNAGAAVSLVIDHVGNVVAVKRDYAEEYDTTKFAMGIRTKDSTVPPSIQ